MDTGVIFGALSSAVATLFAAYSKALYDQLRRADADRKTDREDHLREVDDLKGAQAVALAELKAAHLREVEGKDRTIEKLERKNDELNTIVDRNSDALASVGEIQQLMVDTLGTLTPPRSNAQSGRRR